MQSQSPIHTLRGILRHLKVKLPKELESKTGGAAAGNGARLYIMEQYRASRDCTDQEKIDRLRTMASEYLQLRDELKERARLYELDTGAEVVLSPKEMSRRAAARAGLQLPEESSSNL